VLGHLGARVVERELGDEQLAVKDSRKPILLVAR
jgi:hypothetical protein